MSFAKWKLECIAKTYAAGEAQADTVVKSVSSGRRFVVTLLDVSVGSAVTADVDFIVEWDADTDVAFAKGQLTAGQRMAMGNGTSEILRGGDGQDLIFTCDNPVGGSAYVHVLGYIEKYR